MASIHDLALTGATGPGLPLDCATRGRLERLFGEDLSDVLVHRSPAVDAMNAASGSLAFAVANHVCIASHLDRGHGRMFDFVVAHEVAHVLQKRRGRNIGCRPRRADDWLVEAEATHAACDVLAGRKATIATADDPLVVRHWGPAGHYWTVFFTALAAGVPEQEAYSCAFYAQLPDQVFELDAVPHGFDAMTYDSIHHPTPLAPTDLPYMSGVVYDVVEVVTVPTVYLFDLEGLYPDCESRAIDQDVQRGLHCLTGGPAREEFEKWHRHLMTCDPRSFGYKLALHAFGDSFAHRMGAGFGTTMYRDPLGHANDDPDDIHNHAVNYCEYTSNLYDVFLATWGLEARLRKPIYSWILEGIIALKTENEKCSGLRDLIDSYAQGVREVCSARLPDNYLDLEPGLRSELKDKSLLEYRPEFEFSPDDLPLHRLGIDSIRWNKFYPRHNHFHDKLYGKRNPALTCHTLREALEKAKLWAADAGTYCR